MITTPGSGTLRPHVGVSALSKNDDPNSRAVHCRQAFGLRSFLLLLALLAGIIPQGLCLPTPPSRPAKEWVSLSEWARENNFNLIWSKGAETLLLTNKTARLCFKTDSLSAGINGITVWLCDPISRQNGEVCISSLDLQATVRPILCPQANPADDPLEVVCLDPGHGGKDTGGVSGRYIEKQYTLPMALELAGQLEAAGFKVVLTRTNDTFVELENRPALANRQEADLFISLHFNVSPHGEARGVEVYCLTPAETCSTNSKGKPANTDSLPGNRQDAHNVMFAYQLQKSLVTGVGADDRGLRRARFAVLRTATMPAVLIEGGFLSDSGEQKQIADPKYRARLAQAIVQGVLDYRRATEP